jgi:hypothetical protein
VGAAGPGPPAEYRERRRHLEAAWAGALRRFRDHMDDHHHLHEHMHEGTRMTEPVDNVRQLRRPPIRQSTVVRSDVAHTFDAFVRTIGAWWPVQTHSMGQERVAGVVFERELGGRIYETWDDGGESTWGHVLAWDPPNGFTMTWDILPGETEVQLSFRALGPALTRVEVEHRGWERLTDEQFAQLPTARGGYSEGWKLILATFARTQE